MVHFLAERVNALEFQEPPDLWTRNIWAVGGLISIGYAQNSDLLLVVSHAGRGVFDCLLNQKVARDHEEVDDYLLIPQQGIGILEGQIIQTASRYNGCLNRRWDGWSLEQASPNWPFSSIILQPPGCNLYDNRTWQQCIKVAPHGDEDDIVTYGFSDTGKSFVVAMSHTLEIFSPRS